jgi:phosphatidylinositol glycan class U
VTVTTHLYTLLLLPLLHSLWLLTGTGNANFFYAATLVYAVANGMGVIDMLGAGLKAQVKQDAGGRLGLSDDEDWDVNGFVPVQYTAI